MSESAAPYAIFVGIALALHFCTMLLAKAWILRAALPRRRFARCMVAVVPSSAIAVSELTIVGCLRDGRLDPFLPLALLFGFVQAYGLGAACALLFLWMKRNR